MRWMMVLLVVAALGVGYGLGALSKSDSGGAPGRVERGAQAPAGAREPGTPARDTWAGLIESIEVEAPKTSTGKIVGRVVDTGGDGLPGVIVVAEPMQRRTEGKVSAAEGRPEQEPLAVSVRQFAKREAALRQGTRETTTDQDGLYALTSLGADGYNVTAYLRGFRATAQRPRGGWDVKPDAELNFEAERVVRVDVDVTLSDGSRPNEADIQVRQTTSNGSALTGTYWTTGARWIELPPGTYALQASLRDGSRPTSDEEPIVVGLDDPPAPVSLRIVIKPSLRISVVPPTGFESVSVRVKALPFSGETPPADDLLRDAQDRTASRPDDQGRILLADLEPGRYLLGASLTYFGAIVARKIVEVGEGQLDVALQLPAPDPSEFMLVRPLGPDGKPLRGLDWIGAFRGKGNSGSSGTTALYRADGVAFVAAVDRYKGMEGEHSVNATHDRYGTARLVVDPSATAPVTMRFEEPAFLDAVVDGYRGSGREGRLSVSLESDGISGRAHANAPDAEGKVSFGPVQPGDYALGLAIAGARHNSAVIASTQVALRSGTQNARLAIPALHELKLVWTGKGKPTFMLGQEAAPRHANRLRLHREVDEKGVAIFRDLVAGEYQLHVANVNERVEPRTIVIPGTSELSLP